MLEYTFSYIYNRLVHYHRYLKVREWESICSSCHSFHFLFCLHRTLYFMSNSAFVSRKAEDGVTKRSAWSKMACSQFLEFGLLIYFCFFVRVFVISCSLLCMSVFPVQPLSLEYISLISALDYPFSPARIQTGRCEHVPPPKICKAWVVRCKFRRFQVETLIFC